MIAGTADGTIHIWNEKKSYSRADLILGNSLADSFCPISSVVVSRDGNLLGARSLGRDSHISLWDISMSSTAAPHRHLVRIENTPNDYPTANLDFR